MKSLNTLWNEEMTKIKVGDLDELYNSYIHHLYSWNHLVFENQVWSCHFLKFKIWIVTWRSDQNKSCRQWGVQQLLCSRLLLLKSFKVWKSRLKLPFSEIQNYNGSNLVKWKYDQNKSCTYWWVVQHWYSWVFHLKSFTLSKYCFNLKLFEF